MPVGRVEYFDGRCSTPIECGFEVYGQPPHPPRCPTFAEVRCSSTPNLVLATALEDITKDLKAWWAAPPVVSTILRGRAMGKSTGSNLFDVYYPESTTVPLYPLVDDE